MPGTEGKWRTIGSPIRPSAPRHARQHRNVRAGPVIPLLNHVMSTACTSGGQAWYRLKRRDRGPEATSLVRAFARRPVTPVGRAVPVHLQGRQRHMKLHRRFGDGSSERAEHHGAPGSRRLRVSVARQQHLREAGSLRGRRRPGRRAGSGHHPSARDALLERATTSLVIRPLEPAGLGLHPLAGEGDPFEGPGVTATRSCAPGTGGGLRDHQPTRSARRAGTRVDVARGALPLAERRRPRPSGTREGGAGQVEGRRVDGIRTRTGR